VYRSAKWILAQGPKYVVVKQGEYGAVLVTPTSTFYVPAYPLEELFDPTGAGDAFAGGFMAFLARSDDVAPANLRRAMVFGSTMGSFAVERFSTQRFDEISLSDVQQRLGHFKDMVSFDIAGEWARGRG
jgi:sugar/nucleoside kinase (ribokinase family)